jgi:ABC-type dipeptide/oligopeptide/nickel transport system ATPase component
MTLLSIKNLKISTKSSIKILKGVSFEIKKGEVVSLVGPSGSGKSLTAMAILGLIPPALHIVGGDISIDGHSLIDISTEDHRNFLGKHIGMIFQDPLSHLNPTMTVGRQIAETLVFHKGFSYKEAKRAAIELLGDVGLPDPEERYHFFPFELSGGQRQRVMIASALACKPSLLLADEPTTALDPETQLQILDLIRSLVVKHGMGLLFITHDLRVANTVADRIAVMHEGVIVENQPKEVFMASQEHPRSRALVEQYRRRYHG